MNREEAIEVLEGATAAFDEDGNELDLIKAAKDVLDCDFVHSWGRFKKFPDGRRWFDEDIREYVRIGTRFVKDIIEVMPPGEWEILELLWEGDIFGIPLIVGEKWDDSRNLCEQEE